MCRWLSLAVVLVAAPAFADEQHPVTFADVVASVGAAPAAKAPVHDVAAADALADAAGAWPMPSLHVQTNSLTARATVAASLPVPVFGTVGAVQRQARAEAGVVRAEATVAQRTLYHRAVAAWIALARADGDVIATSIAAQQASELELIAKGRLDAGVGADVDVTTARASRARAELAASAAVRAQEAASAELAGVLGWDPGRRLRSDGPFPTGQPEDLAALRARLVTHPERALGVRRVAAADAAVEQAKSLRFPVVALEGQAAIDDPTNEHQNDYIVGVTFDVPVFSKIGDRVRAARATAAAQRARLAATEAELAGGLAAAFERYQAASERLRALETAVVPAQERAAALSAQAYREGARDVTSALTAARDLSAVRAEVNAARADAATAWEDLRLASGVYDAR
jgi:outer membrane protein TolC